MMPGTTLAHAAESEARPEKTHASFKVVLPNLRQGCALWRKIAMQKADAAPMGQKKHHRRLHHGSEKKKHHSRDNFGSNTGTCCRVRSAARRNTRFIQSGAAKPAPRLCAWRNTATDSAVTGMQRITPAPTRSCAMNYRCCCVLVHAMNYSYCCAIVRSEKTHTLAKYAYASKRSRAMNYRGMQWITAAAAPSCGQKKHTRYQTWTVV